MSEFADLYGDAFLTIIKYYYQKKGSKFPKVNSLYSFVNNYLTEFVCVILNIKKIPEFHHEDTTSNKRINDHLRALDYLSQDSINHYLKFTDCYLNSDYFRLIKKIIKYYCFPYNLKNIMSISKKLFKSIGIKIKKDNDICNGLYFIRLLHILTNGEVKLANNFDPSTGFRKILSPMFSKYNIPFILKAESCDSIYFRKGYFFLQTQIIFDRFDERIKILLNADNDEEYSNEEEEEDTASNYQVNCYEIEEEKIFLRLVNILGKRIDKNFDFFDFDSIIENGFIPLYLMHALNVDSIENVTNVHEKSMDVQINNVEAIIEYLHKNNQIFDYLIFDFRTPANRSFSTRLLLRSMFNMYFLTTPKEKMVDRFNRLFNENVKITKPKTVFGSDVLIKIAYFIVEGRSPEKIWELKDQYCKNHKLPYIFDVTTFRPIDEIDDRDFFYYQLQLFYDVIDKRPSLRFIEKLRNASYKFKKVKLPKLSMLSSAMKAKKYVSKDIKTRYEEEELNEEEECIESSIGLNNRPTTFQDRYKQEIANITKTRNSNENTQTESSQNFWNSNELQNAFHMDKGILLPIENKYDQQVIDKWNDTISNIPNTSNNQEAQIANQQNDTLSQQTSDSKLYKLFYYNEDLNKWEFNEQKFSEFVKDNNLSEYQHTPIICFIDSNEEDLIKISSNCFVENYPKLDSTSTANHQQQQQATIQKKSKYKRKKRNLEQSAQSNEIFVYSMSDKTLSMITNDLESTDEVESTTKPILLFLHVPKEKENIPNIKLIIIQIYIFLSLISDIRVVVLDKMSYQSQILNLLCVFNIADKNIQELINKPISENESSNHSLYFPSKASCFIDKDDNIGLNSTDNPTNAFEQLQDNGQMIYSDSNLVFLINEKTINNFIQCDKYVNDGQISQEINQKFANKAIIHLINSNLKISYNSYLNTIRSLSLKKTTSIVDFLNNCKCINQISHISSRYITIKENLETQSSLIETTIRKRYSILKENKVSTCFDTLQNEIANNSPQFDVSFQNQSEVIINAIKKDNITIDRNKLQAELHQSATENLEFLNYRLHQQYFWEKQQLEEMQRNHLEFLDEEYFSIIQLISNIDIAPLLYEENLDILQNQKQLDKDRLQEICSLFYKRIEMKNSQIEEELGDMKLNGVNYIMKETESIREIKVTLEMKDKLKTIIEQDF